jgi:hypothetical protein
MIFNFQVEVISRMDDFFNILNEISYQYDLNRRNDIVTDFDIDLDVDYSTNQGIINNLHTIRIYLENQRRFMNSTTSLTNTVPITQSSFVRFNINDTFLEHFLRANYDELVNNFTEGLEDVKVTLSEEEFNNLENVVLDKTNIDRFNDKCNICLDEFVLEQNVILLNCKHFFHNECIKNWLTNQSTKCPICRNPQRDG